MTSSQHRIPVVRAQRVATVVVSLALLFCALLWGVPALRAQETPSVPPLPEPTAPSRLSITPSQIAIAAQRGAVESRQLLLRSDGAIAALDFFAQDLTNGDGTRVLPARAIDMMLPLTGSLTSPMTMDLVVDLERVPAGAYSGDALLTFDDSDQWITLRVDVKDPPWLPLAVLLLGVLLGVGLNLYRRRVAPRDTKLVEINDLLREVDSDQELRATGSGVAFRRRIDLYLADAGSAVRGGAWEEARTQIDRARAVLDLWRRERDGWRKVLERQASLRTDLTATAPYKDDAGPYLTDLRLALEEVVDETVEDALAALHADTPPNSHVRTLDERLKRIYELMGIYANEIGALTRGQALLEGAIGEAATAARAQLDLLESELRQIRPWSDANALALLSDLHVRIKRAAFEVQGALQPAAPAGPETPAPAVAPMADAAPRPSTWTPLDSIATPRQVQQARSRSLLFQYVSFIVAVALLAGAGFQELYLGRTTFGSNLWADYFALLAWGFGAEATRSAVTELIRGWDLPLLTSSTGERSGG